MTIRWGEHEFTLLTRENGQQENVIRKRNQSVRSQFIENTIFFQTQIQTLCDRLQMENSSEKIIGWNWMRNQSAITFGSYFRYWSSPKPEERWRERDRKKQLDIHIALATRHHGKRDIELTTRELLHLKIHL